MVENKIGLWPHASIFFVGKKAIKNKGIRFKKDWTVKVDADTNILPMSLHVKFAIF